MKANEVKQKAASGFIYKFAERVGAQGIHFLISMLLARILLPEQYGLIALVAIFITICDVFVTYGFGNSLVANKDSDSLDFSTCFYFGVGLALAIYLGVFFLAPVLARFYDEALLTPVIRVMGLRVILAGVNSIQHAYVSKHMMFRKFFYSTLIGTVVSGVIAVIMAFNGFGVWALVEQYLGNVLMDTVFLWIVVGWRPKREFSFARLKKIYRYGWKILVTGLIDTGYQQLRSLVIGHRYTKADLAYYNKGMQFPVFTNKLIEPTVNTVLFPSLANSRDHPEQMYAITRRVVKVATYILAPVMVGLAVIAEPMVTLILTKKWLPCVVFLRIGCISYFVRPLMYVSNSVIKARGRSDLLLKLDVIKKIVGVTLMLVSMNFGVFWIAVSLAVTTVVSTGINVVANHRLLDYSYRDQLMDVIVNFLLALGMGAAVWPISLAGLHPFPTLILQITAGIAVYIAASKILRIDSFEYLLRMIRGFLNRRKAKKARKADLPDAGEDEGPVPASPEIRDNETEPIE